MYVSRGDVDRRRPGEGLAPRHHLVQQDAHGVHVRAGIAEALRDEFWTEVGNGSEDGARGCGRHLGDGPREAEVGEFGLAIRVHEHVLRLDVAVDQAEAVGRAYRFEELLRDAHGLAEGNGALHRETLP